MGEFYIFTGGLVLGIAIGLAAGLALQRGHWRP